MYVYANILGHELNRGVMRVRKGEKYCKVSWFMEI
jgi:hypothetical protein